MDRMQFPLPVRIVTEAGEAVTEIYDVEEALTFLQNWPAARGSPIFQRALNACFAVTIDEAQPRKRERPWRRSPGLPVFWPKMSRCRGCGKPTIGQGRRQGEPSCCGKRTGPSLCASKPRAGSASSAPCGPLGNGCCTTGRQKAGLSTG
jgi:hypothetical protein